MPRPESDYPFSARKRERKKTRKREKYREVVANLAEEQKKEKESSMAHQGGTSLDGEVPAPQQSGEEKREPRPTTRERKRRRVKHESAHDTRTIPKAATKVLSPKNAKILTKQAEKPP